MPANHFMRRNFVAYAAANLNLSHGASVSIAWVFNGGVNYSVQLKPADRAIFELFLVEPSRYVFLAEIYAGKNVLSYQVFKFHAHNSPLSSPTAPLSLSVVGGVHPRDIRAFLIWSSLVSMICLA